jgi:hypothetical protein
LTENNNAAGSTIEAPVEETFERATGATMYRIGLRKRLTDENVGMEFAQVSTSTDRFTKDGVEVDVFHGPSNLMTGAEINDGQGQIIEITGQRKLEQLLQRLAGFTGSRWVMNADERASIDPIGKGLGLFEVTATAPEVVEETPTVEEPTEEITDVVAPEAKPVPRPAPRTKKNEEAKTG